MDEETLRAITDSYQEGKRDGAEQERREIIKTIKAREAASYEESLYQMKLLDIIEKRWQQQDTNVPLTQQEET